MTRPVKVLPPVVLKGPGLQGSPKIRCTDVNLTTIGMQVIICLMLICQTAGFQSALPLCRSHRWNSREAHTALTAL